MRYFLTVCKGVLGISGIAKIPILNSTAVRIGNAHLQFYSGALDWLGLPHSHS